MLTLPTNYVQSYLFPGGKAMGLTDMQFSNFQDLVGTFKKAKTKRSLLPHNILPAE